jgi:hypothetical protein
MPCAIGCVAVLSPDNAPILIRKIADENQDFEFDTIIFCAIDRFVPQPAQRKTTIRSADRLIGPFQASDGPSRFQVWGYKTSLGYKIIVLSIAQPAIPDHAVRTFCEKVRDAVFDRLMDPFYQPFSAMDSPAILDRILRDAEAITIPSA